MVVTKVSPNHPSKMADRIAGAILDRAYELKKNPRVGCDVKIEDSKCWVILESSVMIDESVIRNIVMRIANIGDVDYHFTLVDGYKDSACSESVSICARIEGDDDRRVVSVCNDVYNSVEGCVYCEFEHPNMEVFVDKEFSEDDIKFCVRHNDIHIHFNQVPRVKGGISNTCLSSDMGIDNDLLHGRDINNPFVALSIYAQLIADKKGGEIALKCEKGDTIVNGVKYRTIVNKAKAYITKIGGFEKLAEWGTYRPLVRE